MHDELVSRLHLEWAVWCVVWLLNVDHKWPCIAGQIWQNRQKIGSFVAKHGTWGRRINCYPISQVLLPWLACLHLSHSNQMESKIRFVHTSQLDIDSLSLGFHKSVFEYNSELEHMTIRVLSPHVLHYVLAIFLTLIEDPDYGQSQVVNYPSHLPFSSILPVRLWISA